MIKFLFYFSVSFLILSIPIEKRQLFYHLDQLATPYTHPVFKKTKIFIEGKLSEQKILGMKIIDTPKKNLTPPKTYRPLASGQDLNRKSEILEIEYYSESELLQLRTMLKNSDI